MISQAMALGMGEPIWESLGLGSQALMVKVPVTAISMLLPYWKNTSVTLQEDEYEPGSDW